MLKGRNKRSCILVIICSIVLLCVFQKVPFIKAADAKTYNITFDANEGEVATTSKSVTVGSTYGTLPTPTRTYYVFKGWYTSKVGGEKVSSDSVVKKTSEHTLYARWVGKKYTITLNANGGKVDKTSVTVYYGSKYLSNLPTSPTRENYDFDGWYTGAKTGDKITGNTIFDKSSKKTLYAHWTAKTLTISLIAFNGEEYEKVATCGKKIGTLPTPTRSGYTFKGWYTRENYSDAKAAAVKEADMVTEGYPLLLFARWESTKE